MATEMDTSGYPTLLVWTDERNWTIGYKPRDVKGARWRSGFKSMPAVSDDADEQIGEGPRLIEFVAERT